MHRMITSAFASIVLCVPAFAQHGGDVALDLDSAGAIRTNLSGKAGAPAPERVFASELGEAFPNFTDEPGFDSEPGTFPAPSEIGFTIRRALRAWNGSAFEDVAPARMEVAFGPLGPVLSPADDTPVTGFSLNVSPNGQWHRHLEFTLGEPASDGVYLLELGLFSSHPSVGASLPFWIVFNQNADEAVHDAAIEWVHENLADACAADFNDDHSVNSQDFFDFLTAFFAGEADFNGDATTNSQDFFDFLTAFFAGC